MGELFGGRFDSFEVERKDAYQIDDRSQAEAVDDDVLFLSSGDSIVITPYRRL